MSNKQKYKTLSKNTLLFTISGFGTKAITFFMVPLYTYVLSTNEFGTVDLLLTTSQLLIPVLTLNIQDAVLRFSLDKENDPHKVIGAGIKICLVSSCILLIALFIINGLQIVNLDTTYLLFLTFVYFWGTLYNCFSMYLRAVDKVKVLMVAGLLGTFLTCVFNIFFLMVIKLGINGYMIANVAGNAIAAIFMFINGKIFKEADYKQSRKLLRLMISYSFPLVFNSIAWWLNNASDRYILTFFSGVAINGIYAVSYKIPTILTTLQSLFYNAWSVSAITEFDNEDKDGFMGNIYTLYSGLSMIGCSILLICNIPIARLLFAKEFFEAWKYVPPLLLGTVFNGLALFEGCIFTAVKRTKDVSKTTLMGAGFNTVMNIILIPNLGALGAAFATLLGYFTVWAMRTYQLKSIIKLKVNWKLQIFGLIILAIQSFVALCNDCYIIQSIALIVIAFSFRKLLLEIVSQVKKIFIHKKY